MCLPRSTACLLLALNIVFTAGLKAQKTLAPSFRTTVWKLLAVHPDQLEVNGKILELGHMREIVKKDSDDEPLNPVQLMAEAIREILVDELRQKNSYLQGDDYDQAFSRYAESHFNSFITLEVSSKIKGYPTPECYKRWLRVRLSFEATVAQDLTEKTVRAAFSKQDESFLSMDRIDVGFLFFDGWHHKKGEWDFAAAEKRAAAAYKALAGGTDPKAVRKTSDALPDAARKASQSPQFFNSVCWAIGEGEYAEALCDRKAGTFIFYEAKVGTHTPPLRTPKGYWIVKLEKRVPSKRRNKGTNLTLLRQMYINRRFQGWVDRVLGEAVLKVPPDKRK